MTLAKKILGIAVFLSIVAITFSIFHVSRAKSLQDAFGKEINYFRVNLFWDDWGVDNARALVTISYPYPFRLTTISETGEYILFDHNTAQEFVDTFLGIQVRPKNIISSMREAITDIFIERTNYHAPIQMMIWPSYEDAIDWETSIDRAIYTIAGFGDNIVGFKFFDRSDPHLSLPLDQIHELIPIPSAQFIIMRNQQDVFDSLHYMLESTANSFGFFSGDLSLHTRS